MQVATWLKFKEMLKKNKSSFYDNRERKVKEQNTTGLFKCVLINMCNLTVNEHKIYSRIEGKCAKSLSQKSDKLERSENKNKKKALKHKIAGG